MLELKVESNPSTQAAVNPIPSRPDQALKPIETIDPQQVTVQLQKELVQKMNTLVPSPQAMQRVDIEVRVREVYEAMKGGVTGLGTDERRLFRGLDGASREEIQKMREVYRDHYGRDLDRDIRAELRDDKRFLDRSKPMLEGDKILSTVEGLHLEKSTPITSKEEIYRLLSDKSPEELQTIQKLYQERYGKPLTEALGEKLKGAELDKAVALLNGQKTEADAATIKIALENVPRADYQTIVQTLHNKDPETVTNIKNLLAEKYGITGEDKLSMQLRPNEREVMTNLLQGDTATADAIMIRDAIETRQGINEEIITKFEGRSEAERTAIIEAYEKRYGTPLVEDLRARSREVAIDVEGAAGVIQTGVVADVERIHAGLHSPDASEKFATIMEAKTPDQSEQLKNEFKERYGRDLDGVITQQLSGTEQFEAKMVALGAPLTLEDEVKIINTKHAFERGGITSLSSKVMDAVSVQGKQLDNNVHRFNEYYREVFKAGKVMEEGDEDRFAALFGYCEEDIQTYREAKRGLARIVSNSSALFAMVIFFLMCQGSSMPTWASFALSFCGGLGTRAAVDAYMRGKSFAGKELIEDLKRHRRNRKKAAYNPFTIKRRHERFKRKRDRKKSKKR